LNKAVKKIRRVLSMPISGLNLVLLLFLVLALSYCFYPRIENFFIFYPEAELEAAPSAWGLDYEDIVFPTGGGKKLHGWFFPAPAQAPVILFCHGNAGNISHRLENIRLLVEQGFQVFIFDYQGYGKSQGSPSEGRLYEDGLAAYDFLTKDKGFPPERIVLFGRSLGAAVAVEIAVNRKVRAVILEGAFTSTKDMAKTLFFFQVFAFAVPLHYNNLEKITRIPAPKLLIHGKEDAIVPFWMGRALYEKAKPPKAFLAVERAGHNDTYLLGGKTYLETLSSFIQQPEKFSGPGTVSQGPE